MASLEWVDACDDEALANAVDALTYTHSNPVVKVGPAPPSLEGFWHARSARPCWATGRATHATNMRS